MISKCDNARASGRLSDANNGAEIARILDAEEKEDGTGAREDLGDGVREHREREHGQDEPADPGADGVEVAPSGESSEHEYADLQQADQHCHRQVAGHDHRT